MCQQQIQPVAVFQWCHWLQVQEVKVGFVKLIENVKGRIGMKKVPRFGVGFDSISYSSLPPAVCADTSHTAKMKYCNWYRKSIGEHGIDVWQRIFFLEITTELRLIASMTFPIQQSPNKYTITLTVTIY